MKKKIYIVTNRKLVKNKNMLDIIESSVLAGADAVILREKDLDSGRLIPLAEKIKKITEPRKIPLIINGNIETALKVNSGGFHTSYTDYMNGHFKFNGTLGVSVHSTSEAVNAEKEGADYLLAGHIFETDCKKGLKPRGISFLKDILSNVSIPVIAIGGINESNIDKLLKTDVCGAAVMSLVMCSDDPYLTTRNLKNHME
ncbi:thiamine phosphate synthase [Clostridium luticellarii]|uniref:Regulatory protein TenI n=1 Tax=Clostridium luticellarii TaxID=1691940 RepID=A0A2T0BHX6_9CLOT|nr:thiamine phosphate synthase [Clostridium luticellarii]MCI1945981.1 thiamine phosphate synthase [Clostridium luticellarii]MCI1969662.1 thiamine phosphate synthase [Clostridium luticellarii]MCI1996651.1 thiamine phosphate synthase [Clostridium luticellarii]MCI2039577.1 thiamine phosphate synthase [Clostridium luticellarii]PRR83495.1 Regulatory protein TenI [Clostridium luticellarii]